MYSVHRAKLFTIYTLETKEKIFLILTQKETSQKMLTTEDSLYDQNAFRLLRLKNKLLYLFKLFTQ